MLSFSDAEVKADLWAWNDFQDRILAETAGPSSGECVVDAPAAAVAVGEPLFSQVECQNESV